MGYERGMQGTLSHRPLSIRDPGRLLLLSGLFWLFTYVLLSIRAAIIPEAVPALFSPQRLLAVTAGATIFYAAARHLVNAQAKPSLTTIFGTFAISIAAALIIRLGLDQVVSEVASVSYSARWTLVWAGYFGIWLMGTLAYFDSSAAKPATHKMAAATVLSAATQPSNQADELAWEWLVDVLAAELAENGSSHPGAVAARLVAKAGYELADSIDGSAHVSNARVHLAHSIASRIQNLAEPA